MHLLNLQRLHHLAVAAILAASGITAHAAPQDRDDPLKTAIAAPTRTPAFVARDAARHPYETLSFFGATPAMTVVELSPGGGWYTEILAPYLRDRGRYIAAVPDPASPNEYLRNQTIRLQQKLAADPGLYGKVEIAIFEPPGKLDYARPGSVDLILTFRNLHNWLALGEDNLKRVLRSAYDALKPGGVLGVVEHRLPENRLQDSSASSGYMHESFVTRMVESVGFKLAGKSEINANPKDTADHPNGVWALPPTYRNKDVDRARYEAIGESDRMTLKFVKPKAAP